MCRGTDLLFIYYYCLFLLLWVSVQRKAISLSVFVLVVEMFILVFLKNVTFSVGLPINNFESVE